MHYNTKSNIFVRKRNWNDDGLYYTIMIIFISTSRIGEKIHKMVWLYIKAAPWKYMQRKTHVKMDNKISIITIVSIITFTIIFITCLTSIIIHFLVLCAPIVLSENRLQSCLSPMVLCGLWLRILPEMSLRCMISYIWLFEWLSLFENRVKAERSDCGNHKQSITAAKTGVQAENFGKFRGKLCHWYQKLFGAPSC